MNEIARPRQGADASRVLASGCANRLGVIDGEPLGKDMSQDRIEAFLAPLVRALRRGRGLETLVFWQANHGPAGWPREPTEILDAEEVAFYIEGLIPEGFCLEWRIIGDGGAPDHIRLYVWEDDSHPPADETDAQVLDRGHWVGA